MKKRIKKYIKQERKKMQRMLIATPETRKHLENFAKTHKGGLLLMQLSINYGYKIALENIENEIRAPKDE